MASIANSVILDLKFASSVDFKCFLNGIVLMLLKLVSGNKA